MNIREITESDYPFLKDFLHNAIFIAPGEELPPHEIIYEPDSFILMALVIAQAITE